MYVDVDTLLQRGFLCVGLWDAGWGWCEKNPAFLCVCVGIRKIPHRAVYKTPQSKVSIYIPFMLFLETEQPTPLLAAAAAADTLLGLHHSAWLTSLG
jgi:hypothetical protein